MQFSCLFLLKILYLQRRRSIRVAGGQDNTQLVGSAGQKSFIAVFTPNDNENYVSVTKSLVVTVEKAKPQVTPPATIEVTEGQSLSEITLPEGWTWKDGSVSVGSDGKITYTAIYTPSDTDNYQVIEMEITVSVAPAGLSGGEIAGVAVGSVAGAGGIGALVWFLIRRKKRTV